MLRLAGALLLTGGAAGLGLCAAGQLRDRVKSLRALEGGLALLARELSFRRAPMPELMERAARGAAAPACYFFARCRDHLDELGSFIWQRIDGVYTVGELAGPVKEQFGEAAEPLYPRIARYFQVLESYGFVTLQEK